MIGHVIFFSNIANLTRRGVGVGVCRRRVCGFKSYRGMSSDRMVGGGYLLDRSHKNKG